MFSIENPLRGGSSRQREVLRRLHAVSGAGTSPSKGGSVIFPPPSGMSGSSENPLLGAERGLSLQGWVLKTHPCTLLGRGQACAGGGIACLKAVKLSLWFATFIVSTGLATGDFQQLLGDAALTPFVVFQSQVLDQALGIIRGVFHRHHACALLAGFGTQQHRMNIDV